MREPPHLRLVPRPPIEATATTTTEQGALSSVSDRGLMKPWTQFMATAFIIPSPGSIKPEDRDKAFAAARMMGQASSNASRPSAQAAAADATRAAQLPEHDKKPDKTHKTANDPDTQKPIAAGNGDGHIGGMQERLSKLEGGFDGIKQSQAILWSGTLGIAALVLAALAVVVTLQFYVLAEVSGIDDRIGAEFRALRAETAAQTSAIANSITATKQQAPQVILVPAPPASAPISPP